MPTYIALLRGINVSGQKKIKMADLRAHLAELPIRHIQTYIQSGNIIFEHENTDPGILERLIHDKIAEKYGYDVPVLVKTAEDLNRVLQNNPFQEESESGPKRVYFTFLASEPDEARIAKLSEVDYQPEKYVLEGKDIYFFSPSGYGRARMSNNFFENKLKVRATTRNWKTTQVLYKMAMAATKSDD
ncbi:MAG: DUF1697 domain-containing protein [Bacteroidota bacterium]